MFASKWLSLTPQSSVSTQVGFLGSSVQFQQATFPENCTSTTVNFPGNSVGFPGSLEGALVGNLLASFSSTPEGSSPECFVGTRVGSFPLASLSQWHLHPPLTHPMGHSHPSVLRVGVASFKCFPPLRILHQLQG